LALVVLLLLVTWWEIMDKILLSLQLRQSAAVAALNTPEMETQVGLVAELLLQD
jgi:hypothetical protein